MAQSRLSIIDLSPAGRQPLYNEDRTLLAVVNGEIYNYEELRDELIQRGHTFSSQSDSEVVVHLYEDEALAGLARLRGMYAIGLYDIGKREVVLLRDDLAIKPLYLYEDDDVFAFASEINAFRSAGLALTPSKGAIADYLLLGCIRAPATLYREVRALVSGECVTIRGGMAEYHMGCLAGRKYASAFCDSRLSPSVLRERMEDSVRRHLISDAPIGLFLSGGIDSGTIAGLARQVSGADIRAVSVVLPGHPLDESSFARTTADLYGIDLAEVPLSQTDFEAEMDQFFERMDMPTVDGFNTYVVAKAAHDAGLTVALSGLGGDELFAGYPTFSWVPTFSRVLWFAASLGMASRAAASQMLRALSNSSGGKRVAEILANAPRDCRSSYLAYRGLFCGRTLSDLLAVDVRHEADAATARFFDENSWVLASEMPLQTAVAGMEIDNYMTPMLLRDTDVFSMAHSLEVRVPLVDREVLRAFFPCLSHRGYTDGAPKWNLRQSLATPLPRGVVQRTKQGFVLPWQEWMKGKAVREFDRILAEGRNWRSLLNTEAVIQHRDAYVQGRAHWRCFWSLYVLMRMIQ